MLDEYEQNEDSLLFYTEAERKRRKYFPLGVAASTPLILFALGFCLVSSLQPRDVDKKWTWRDSSLAVLSPLALITIALILGLFRKLIIRDSRGFKIHVLLPFVLFFLAAIASNILYIIDSYLSRDMSAVSKAMETVAHSLFLIEICFHCVLFLIFNVRELVVLAPALYACALGWIILYNSAMFIMEIIYLWIPWHNPVGSLGLVTLLAALRINFRLQCLQFAYEFGWDTAVDTIE